MLLLDGRSLQTPSAVRGIGSYVRGLLEGLREEGGANEIGLLLSAGRPDPPELESLSLQAASGRIAALHPTLQPVADPLLVARAVRRLRPALYHAVEWGQPLWSSAAVVVTVHDLIPFIFPRQYPWVRRAHLAALRLLRRADRIIAVSQSTARDVERIAHVTPDRISVIGEGISSTFVPADPEAVQRMRRRFGLRGRYVLAVGTFDPRKRIDNLARVARRLTDALPLELVVAGEQGSFLEEVMAAIRGAGLTHRAHVLGHVEPGELAALYTGSKCLLFTSAYEGFGLPPLEAMRCATAVVMYCNSSLPEIAGEAAVLVPDGDAEAMAEAASRLIRDGAERSRRIAIGRRWSAEFTWRRAAQKTRAVYEDAQGAARARGDRAFLGRPR